LLRSPSAAYSRRATFLEGLQATFAAGKLSFFADLAALNSAAAFTRYVAPLRRAPWVVYAKAPFAGPQQVLAYLVRYTGGDIGGRCRRLLATDGGGRGGYARRAVGDPV
jgi:Putative transposase